MPVNSFLRERKSVPVLASIVSLIFASEFVG